MNALTCSHCGGVAPADYDETVCGEPVCSSCARAILASSDDDSDVEREPCPHCNDASCMLCDDNGMVPA